MEGRAFTALTPSSIGNNTYLVRVREGVPLYMSRRAPHHAVVSVTTTGTIDVMVAEKHWPALKRVPGGKLYDTGRWEWLAHGEAAKALIVAFADVDVPIEAADDFYALAGVAAPSSLDIPPVPHAAVADGAHRDWGHQEDAASFIRDRRSSMLAMGMGTGKSRVVVKECDEKHHDLVIITAPKAACRVWPREFRKHGARPYRVCVLGWEGDEDKGFSVEQKVAQAEKHVALCRAKKVPCVVVLNHESFWRWPFGDAFETDARGRVLAVTRGYASKIAWDLVVVDESHRAKDPRGRLSLFLAGICREKRVLALTGTPMPHSPLDVFAQARFIDSGVFGTNYNHFKKRYAKTARDVVVETAMRIADAPSFDVAKQRIKDDNALHMVFVAQARKAVNRFLPEDVLDRLREPSYAALIGMQNATELAKKIDSFAFVVKSEDVLDLPPVRWATRTCVMSDETRKAYDDLEARFYADVAEGSVTADNALVRLLRLHQVSSGHVRVDDGEVRKVGTHKKDALLDLITDLDTRSPIIVGARFTEDLNVVRAVAEELDLNYGELSGRENTLLDADACIRDGIQVGGVNVQSGGVGVDFTKSHVGVFLSCGFNGGDYEQFIKRFDRPGQEKHVLMVKIITHDTIDTVIYGSLKRRKNVVEAVMALRRAPEDEDDE